MFFTSCIIIAFFCFAFYLIWNQFLKKDTRLNTGLKVLRKKISELQNLSVTVEAQVDRHGFAMNDKIQRMEYLLQKSKEVCQQMEKQIELATALQNKNNKVEEDIKNPVASKSHISPSSVEKKDPSHIKAIHLKMVNDKSKKPKQAYFGESPFVKLGFVEPVEGKKKSSPLDPSPSP